LQLRTHNLQNRISQEIADIRNQKEELQEILETKSKGIAAVFKKPELGAFESEISELGGREGQLYKRYHRLRAYLDKDAYEKSKLDGRVDREINKRYPGLGKKIEPVRISVQQSKNIEKSHKRRMER